MKIAVVGLGKLGSPLAAVLAYKGHEVWGVDINAAAVEKLAAGVAPVAEPGLQDLLDQGRSRLQATTDFKAAIPETDVSFVIVPTPSRADGTFSNQYLLDALREIGAALRTSDRYHVVNITSTVMPGSTGGEIRKTLEQASGRRVGDNLGLTYNPEFIALGTVVRDLLHPDMVLIGQSDPRAGDLLEAVYRTVAEGNPPVQRMNWINAEITKISVNTFVTTKISYANMLSDLCDRLEGADVDVVTAALGCDSRIGSKYLRGGLGFGGPCFPRDNKAWSALARGVGARPDLAEATEAVNDYQLERLTTAVLDVAPPGATVAVLGLSYKPGTPVIEASQGVMLAERLAALGFSVLVHDELAVEPTLAVLGDMVRSAASAEAAIAEADAVVVTSPVTSYAALDPKTFAGRKRKVVIDCWRLYDVSTFSPYVDVIHIGAGGLAKHSSDEGLRRGA